MESALNISLTSGYVFVLASLSLTFYYILETINAYTDV